MPVSSPRFRAGLSRLPLPPLPHHKCCQVVNGRFFQDALQACKLNMFQSRSKLFPDSRFDNQPRELLSILSSRKSPRRATGRVG